MQPASSTLFHKLFCLDRILLLPLPPALPYAARRDSELSFFFLVFSAKVWPQSSPSDHLHRTQSTVI